MAQPGWQVPGVPPDWYPDPAGVAEYRYWDGRAWTGGVVIGGQVTERPLPPFDPATMAQPPLGPVAWPARALWVALVGFLAGVAGGLVVVLVGHAAGMPAVALLALGTATLWTGLVGACVAASRRFGTGRVREDFGIGFAWMDGPWGFLTSVAARMLGALVAIPVITMLDDDVGPPSGLFDDLHRDGLTVVVVVVIALIGAPVVEELFFRGLLQRSLGTRLGDQGAIAVQAALFAVVHLSPVLGRANLVVLAVIFPAGVVLGVAARARGLGTSMVGHSLFNVVAVVVTLSAG